MRDKPHPSSLQIEQISFFRKKMLYGVAAEKLFHYKPLNRAAPIV
jgi:hypothetical protein